MSWKADNVSGNQIVDANSKTDHVFRMDFRKCHATVRSCVNVLTATGTAISTIAAEIQFAKPIQIMINWDSALLVVKARFHKLIFSWLDLWIQKVVKSL